jgi:hypothetical protein
MASVAQAVAKVGRGDWIRTSDPCAQVKSGGRSDVKADAMLERDGCVRYEP